MSSPSPFLIELPRAEMEIIDLSEPFGYGGDFSNDDHGDSFQEDWETKSFLHQGRAKTAKKTPSSQRRVPKVQEEWEGSQVTDELSTDPNDNVFHDFSDPPSPDEEPEVPSGLDEISKKLSRLNKHLPAGGLKIAAQLAAASTINGIPVDRFQEGNAVVHPSYGPGVITSVEGKGLRRMARVLFADGENKSFQLSKSKLELA